MHRVEDLSADGAVAVDAERDGLRQRGSGDAAYFAYAVSSGKSRMIERPHCSSSAALAAMSLQRMIGGFLPDADQSDHENSRVRGEQHRGLPAVRASMNFDSELKRRSADRLRCRRASVDRFRSSCPARTLRNDTFASTLPSVRRPPRCEHASSRLPGRWWPKRALHGSKSG